MTRWLVRLGAALTLAGCGAVPLPPAVGSPTAVVNRWRVVSYQGVHVTVPASWPVVDGMHTWSCGGPFPPTPTAFVGPQQNPSPACPALGPGSHGPRDGAWLRPGNRPPDWRTVATASGHRVLEQDRATGDSLEVLWYHGVLVDIGIGPDPATAMAISESIGYAPDAPDTVATGACARSADPPTMPVPERLATPLVLHDGDITLAPPLPSDQPTISAEDAWHEARQAATFERHRLILARYSARFPAHQNPDGSLTPINHNLFAWVIYSSPYTAIAGCGQNTVMVVDPRSGTMIGGGGW